MVKEVKAYQTSDGMIFDSQQDAFIHEAIEMVTGIIENRPLAKRLVENSSTLAPLFSNISEYFQEKVSAN